ncbi:DUF3987 domain-containing protein [Neobacillus terrae]|uniref:DUF3987 domain-containing protein n=1 Tax=Neobacillus terrae TaxID=3034837 RepID=UPI00140A3225|nr:DUF3987 domain-containing protein [Neobacillus terrae]NHM32210.1 DUF3987 domain-containing protein [Neobacillus terrae]
MQDISIISMVFTAVLVLGCLFLVLSPLFKWDVYLSLGTKTADPSSTKEALLTTLNEIEFEYKMDKISDSDYKVLKKQYESQIASMMKEEEQASPIQADKDLLAEVEREIEETMQTYKKKKGEEK